MKFTFLALLKFVLYEWTATLKIDYRVKPNQHRKHGFSSRICIYLFKYLNKK
jgi:hypothetical protein